MERNYLPFRGSNAMKVLLKRSAIKSTAILTLRLAVFLAAAYLNILKSFRSFGHSDNFILYSWGLIFGIVILVWQVRSVREAINVRNAAFLFAAALIWLLVFTLLSRYNFVFHPFFFPGTVALGTILLATIHARVLGASKRRVLIAIPSILGLWYLLSYTAGRFGTSDFILNFLHIPHPLSYGLDATKITVGVFGVEQTIWQGAYLLFMFSPRPYWPFPFFRSVLHPRS